MGNILPIVLWYSGLLGVALAALLVLWALALIAIKQSTALFTGRARSRCRGRLGRHARNGPQSGQSTGEGA
jgi:hypothetical protein